MIFLLIMKLATPEKKLRPELSGNRRPVAEEVTPVPHQGDSPYADYFSQPVYNASSKRTLNVRNHTGSDIIALIFSDSGFVRSFFMQDGYSAEVMQLPKETLFMCYSSGKQFDYLRKLSIPGVLGGFSAEQHFYKTGKAMNPAMLNELNLLPGLNAGFVETNESDFFSLRKVTK